MENLLGENSKSDLLAIFLPQTRKIPYFMNQQLLLSLVIPGAEQMSLGAHGASVKYNLLVYKRSFFF